jgi:hypothetical protein
MPVIGNRITLTYKDKNAYSGDGPWMFLYIYNLYIQYVLFSMITAYGA